MNPHSFKEHIMISYCIGVPMNTWVNSEVGDSGKQRIGLAKKFIRVFHTILQKPEQTFWPTQ